MLGMPCACVYSMTVNLEPQLWVPLDQPAEERNQIRMHVQPAARRCHRGMQLGHRAVRRDTSGVSLTMAALSRESVLTYSGRCSVTRLLITNPDYRVCSCCPAVSLMPPSCTSPPIPVNETGQDLDYTRSASRLVDPAVPANGDSPRLGLVNMLLEEAVVCLHCGGRWVRVF